MYDNNVKIYFAAPGAGFTPGFFLPVVAPFCLLSLEGTFLPPAGSTAFFNATGGTGKYIFLRRWCSSSTALSSACCRITFSRDSARGRRSMYHGLTLPCSEVMLLRWRAASSARWMSLKFVGTAAVTVAVAVPVITADLVGPELFGPGKPCTDGEHAGLPQHCLLVGVAGVALTVGVTGGATFRADPGRKSVSVNVLREFTAAALGLELPTVLMGMEFGSALLGEADPLLGVREIVMGSTFADVVLAAAFPHGLDLLSFVRDDSL